MSKSTVPCSCEHCEDVARLTDQVNKINSELNKLRRMLNDKG